MHERTWSPKVPMGASHCGHLEPARLGTRTGIPNPRRINSCYIVFSQIFARRGHGVQCSPFAFPEVLCMPVYPHRGWGGASQVAISHGGGYLLFISFQVKDCNGQVPESAARRVKMACLIVCKQCCKQRQCCKKGQRAQRPF